MGGLGGGGTPVLYIIITRPARPASLVVHCASGGGSESASSVKTR